MKEREEHSLLKEVIADALAALTEQEFDRPFRQLLDSMGFECLRSKTIHGPYEFGKDIVALRRNPVSAEPRLFVFQTKRGNITQARWSEMQRQVQEMLLTEVRHPNVIQGEPRKPVWVCTGDLDPKVEQLLFDTNCLYTQQGQPSIEVWSRNRLVELFSEHFFTVELFPESERDSVHRLLLSFDGHEFDVELLRTLLAVSPSTPDKIASGRLRSFLLLGHYLLGRAKQVGDMWSAANAFQHLLMSAWGQVVLRKDLSDEWLSRIDSLHDALLEVVQDLLVKLEPASQRPVGLLAWPPTVPEIVAYPVRTIEVCAWTAYLCLTCLVRRDLDQSRRWGDMLVRLIQNNRSAARPIWDCQSGDFFIIGLALRHHGAMKEAEEWLRCTLQWLERFWRDGHGLASAKDDQRKAVEYVFGYPFEQVRLETMRSSELLCVCLGLLSVFGSDDLSVSQRDAFDAVTLAETVPSDEEGAFLWDRSARKEYARAVPDRLSGLKGKLMAPVSAQRDWECVKSGRTHLLFLANRIMRQHSWWLLDRAAMNS